MRRRADPQPHRCPALAVVTDEGDDGDGRGVMLRCRLVEGHTVGDEPTSHRVYRLRREGAYLFAVPFEWREGDSASPHGRPVTRRHWSETDEARNA